MYHFLIKFSSYTQTTALNTRLIMSLAPDAKVFDESTTERSSIQNYWELIDDDSKYSAIEVENEDQANELIRFSDKLATNVGWYGGKLIYVFRDIDLDRLGNDAVMLKLSGTESYEEDPELSHKNAALTYFNRKLNKFLSELHNASTHMSDEVHEKFIEASMMFTLELEETKKVRKKAKAEATKRKTSLRNKLVKFAVYKDAR